MTIKEFNDIRSRIFIEAMKNPEISSAVQNSGSAILYEVMQGEKHGIFVVERSSHMNDAFLVKNGFDPARARIEKIFALHRDTKCVYFW